MQIVHTTFIFEEKLDTSFGFLSIRGYWLDVVEENQLK